MGVHAIVKHEHTTAAANMRLRTLNGATCTLRTLTTWRQRSKIESGQG
jgi:hypothetical protein